MDAFSASNSGLISLEPNFEVMLVISAPSTPIRSFIKRSRSAHIVWAIIMPVTLKGIRKSPRLFHAVLPNQPISDFSSSKLSLFASRQLIVRTWLSILEDINQD